MIRRLPPHPSGAPIRETEPKREPVWRIPPDSFLTPRLRPRYGDLDCVGFHTGYSDEAEEDE